MLSIKTRGLSKAFLQQDFKLSFNTNYQSFGYCLFIIFLPPVLDFPLEKRDGEMDLITASKSGYEKIVFMSKPQKINSILANE